MEPAENKTLLSWTAPEFIHYEKKTGWFVASSTVAAAVVVVSLIMKNYVFALLVPIAYFLLYVHSQKRPRRITINITGTGIDLGKNLFLPHEEILSFWIFEETEIRSLCLETKKLLQPKIFVLLGDKEPSSVRQTMIKFVKEKKQQESLTDIVARKLKF